MGRLLILEVKDTNNHPLLQVQYKRCSNKNLDNVQYRVWIATMELAMMSYHQSPQTSADRYVSGKRWSVSPEGFQVDVVL